MHPTSSGNGSTFPEVAGPLERVAPNLFLERIAVVGEEQNPCVLTAELSFYQNAACSTRRGQGGESAKLFPLWRDVLLGRPQLLLLFGTWTMVAVVARVGVVVLLMFLPTPLWA